MNDLIIRSLSGIFYVGLIILSLISSDAWLWGFILFSIFYFIQTDELIRLLRLDKISFFLMSVLFWLGISTGIIYSVFTRSFQLQWSIELVYFIAFVWILFIIFMIFSIIRTNLSAIFALFYLAIPFSLTLVILMIEPLLILFLFFIIWIYDTFAYLTGRFFGKHKLAPAISPKKTWEGVAGGMLAVIISVYLIWKYHLLTDYFYFLKDAEFSGLIPMLILIIILATAGDLFESFLKRRAGVKDSGNIMPGHGGLLDRLDSYMFAITGFFFYLIFVFKLF